VNEEMGRQREAAERLDAATRESYRAAVDHAFELQKDGMKLSRAFFQNWLETLEEGAEINRRALEDLQRLAAEQRRVFYGLSRESLDAYDGFLDSLALYEEEISREGTNNRGF
jgi:nuclear transport factor 2 (NTF2) superfamily protein